MTKKICIVGSGPSGVTAAYAILKSKNYTVTLLDNSRVLDKLSDAPRVTKRFLENKYISPKFLFGNASELLEKRFDFISQADTDKPLIVSNNVAGGHSKIWGACTPDLDLDDTKDLGIDNRTVRTIEKQIISDIIPSTSIYELFSLKRDVRKESYLKTPSGKFYAGLKDSGVDIHYSKVAVNFNKSKKNCTLCGSCIKGCNYGAIWDASSSIEKLKKYGKKFEYLTDHELIRFEEKQNSVLAFFKTKGSVREMNFTKLLIACGTIPSTRIVSRSLGITGKIRLLHNPFSVSAYITNSLANMTDKFGLSHHSFELKKCSLSKNFNITFDSSTIPEYIISDRLYGPFRLRKTISEYINKRSILVLTYLDSDNSDLWVNVNKEREFSFDENENCEKELYDIKRVLASKLRKFGFYQLPFSFKVGGLGADLHYGGTIPMTQSINERPPLYSDNLGRPNKCKNVAKIDPCR